MKCERCGKETEDLVRRDNGNGWEYVCLKCATKTPIDEIKPPPDGDVFINQNGACFMSVKTMRKLVDADKIASAYIGLKKA